MKKDFSAMNIVYGGGLISDIDIDRVFLVYSVAVINGIKNYLLYDVLLSSDFEVWGWYPSSMFEVTDERKSKYWIEYNFEINENNEYAVTKLLSHESFSKLNDLYVGVCERRQDIVDDFHHMKDKYDEEFSKRKPFPGHPH